MKDKSRDISKSSTASYKSKHSSRVPSRASSRKQSEIDISTVASDREATPEPELLLEPEPELQQNFNDKQNSEKETLKTATKFNKTTNDQRPPLGLRQPSNLSKYSGQTLVNEKGKISDTQTNNSRYVIASRAASVESSKESHLSEDQQVGNSAESEGQLDI